MAIIYSYPQIGELATGDTIAISDASNGNKTKSVTIGQLDSYINTGQATIIQVDDRVVTGASFNTGSGLLTLTRNGGDIPSVTTNLDGRYYLSSNPNSYTSNLGVVQSLTTNNSSGAATLVGGVLNIPQYSGGGGGGGVTEITTTAPITGGTITTTGTIGITQASGSADGYLSSTDWNTFNSKSTFDGQFSSLSNTPTTIAGYGITDALQLGITSTTALAGNTTTITNAQATAIVTNSGKTSFPGFGTTAGTALEGNTALLQLGTTSTTALAGDTTTISVQQASDITANNLKVSFPEAPTDGQQYARQNSGWFVVSGGSSGTVTSVAATHAGNAFTATIGNVSTVNPSVDITLNGSSSQYINGAGDLTTFPTITTGTVESVGLSMPAAFSVANSPVTTSGTLTVTGAGTTSQYVDGTGALQTFPTIPTVPTNIVETVDTTNGDFIDLTPSNAVDGDVVITADLSATGTADNTTFLRGDNTWAVPSGGGGGVTSIIAGTGIGVDQSTGDVTITNTGSATGAYATLTRTFSGNELVNAFSGNTTDEILLVTVPTGYQAILLGEAIQYVDYNTGTTDYTGTNLILRISAIPSTNYISLSSTIFTNSSFPFYITNGQTNSNNNLSASNLGQDITLVSNSTSQRSNFTAGDRDVTISFTYRLINLNL